MWTLWLVSAGFMLGNSAPSPGVISLAEYPTQQQCQLSIERIYGWLKQEYTPPNKGALPPNPGIMFCVEGARTRSETSGTTEGPWTKYQRAAPRG
jgi:hypothetical protein